MAEENETLTLAPRAYGKLGVYHCGVTREGFVTAGGDISEIADGGSVTFDKVGITVTRQGEDYTFTRGNG